MTVWIKEEQFEYTSDYSDGWSRAKSDFKFPVPIGRHKCFIKRFNKSTDSISGWELLNSLLVKIEDGDYYTMSKHEKNLPKVHDIVKTVEKNEKIHYVFLELIEGDTLSKMLSEHVEIDLEKLTEDLFSAFQSLNKYNFWFADFFEKNFCCDRKGNFYLVDLDSAQPASKVPDIEMWGEKEYWALVSDFYRQIVGRHNFTPSNVSGILLNYLQTIFLILRIKIFNSQRDKEYHDVNIHPAHLNKISPEFKEIFTRALGHNSHENQQAIISEIKHLIKEKIIQSTGHDDGYHPATYSSEPLIKKFAITDFSTESDGNFIIESGKPFIMRWEVENASDIQLYKNGQFFRKIQHDEESIELVEEVYDRDEKKVEFELIASHSGEVVSEILAIIITQGEPAIDSFEVGNYSKKNGNDYEVENDQKFNLSWSVRNAESVKLYKNSNLLHEFANDENEVDVTEKIYDGRSKPIEYSLEAISGSKSETKRLTVHLKLARPNPPAINNFMPVGDIEKKGENYLVENKKRFNLSWEVGNVTKVKLFRNGALLNEFSNNENEIELTEAFDLKEKIVEYKLTAFNNSTDTVSKSITVAPKEMVVDFHVGGHAKKIEDNEFVVIKDKPFKLKWHVENVQNLGLLRNGKSYETLSTKEEVIELRETVADEKQTPVEYTLVASNGSEIQKRSFTVKVEVKTTSPVNWMYIIAGFIIIGIVITFAYYKLNNNKDKIIVTKVPDPPPVESPVINPITKDKISENDTLILYGENLPENDNAVQILFDSVGGKIVRHTENSVHVLVPHVEGNNVMITAKVNDTVFTLANNVPYHGKAPTPTRASANNLQITQVLENSDITITGENLPTTPGSVSVKFNNASGTIKRQTPKKVIVRVPALPEGEPVDIVMRINGETFRVAKGVSIRKPVVTPPPAGAPVTLNSFNQGTITEDEIITIRGNNLPAEPGTVQVIFDGKVKFNIVEQASTYIRVKVPTLALRSGILAVKIKDKFIPLPNSLVFYRLRNQ